VFSELLATNRAVNLQRALQSNREIGVAMGILMQRNQFTRQQAFDVLRVASQSSNRKLADIASEVADTGTLTITR
jgi:AmiR/NasT family two-component response regulator